MTVSKYFGGKVQVQIQLADEIEFLRINGRITVVKRVDHPAPQLAKAAILPPQESYVRESGRIFREDCRRLIGRAVIDDDP